MKKILVLLFLLLPPIGVAAQQPFFNDALYENYIINESEIKKSQQSQHDVQFWLNAGRGIITTLGNGSGTLTAGLSIQFDKNLFTLRAYRVAGNLVDDFYDIGLLYGRAISKNSFQFSLAAGLGLGTGEQGVRTGKGIAKKEVSTIGIPIELKVNWELTNFIGLGLTGFANINSVQSFAGVTINVLVGRLR